MSGIVFERSQAQAGAMLGRADAHTRSLAKAISWRMTGSLDTFVVSFLVTGKPALAGSIAATEVVTKVVLYYTHERIWGLFRWGRRA
jgi:uncharacterized membrane protein